MDGDRHERGGGAAGELGPEGGGAFDGSGLDEYGAENVKWKRDGGWRDNLPREPFACILGITVLAGRGAFEALLSNKLRFRARLPLLESAVGGWGWDISLPRTRRCSSVGWTEFVRGDAPAQGMGNL